MKSVLSGSNYIRGSRGMALLSESLRRLLLEYYISHEDVKSDTDVLVSHAVEFNTSLKNYSEEQNEKVCLSWKTFGDMTKNFSAKLSNFQKMSREQSQQLKYWELFLNSIYTPLRYL